MPAPTEALTADPATLRGFAALVAEMRTRRREYFRTKSPAALDASKALERRVDHVVRECLEQPKLF